jgi:hypothetical protein
VGFSPPLRAKLAGGEMAKWQAEAYPTKKAAPLEAALWC